MALLALGAGLGEVGLPAGTAWAYRHHDSRIHYQPYAQAAFDQARRENKPVYVFLSASWCFWCRYFQEETLEQPEVARLMNEQFIPVFVDLDRRQDLQQRYVRKGIPTSVVFTPEGKEYLSFSGTLKKEEFLAGIRQVLARIHQPGGVAEREDAPSVRNVRPFLATEAEIAGKGGRGKVLRASASAMRQVFREAVLDNVDFEHGGLGQQSKYPLAPVWEEVLTGPRAPDAQEGREAVLVALDRIAMHLADPLEGGFYRYAEDSDWGRIHYEKMLVTNARLAHAYAVAAGALPAADAERAARWRGVAGQTLRFLLDVLYRPEGGGFYGSLDGRRPRYYRYDAGGRERERKRGRAPQVDRTVYTAGNGEAVYLLADLLQRAPEPRLRGAVEQTLRLLRERLLTESQGMHGHLRPEEGRAEGVGQLKDNAWAALAFVTGYELTGNPAYLEAFDQVLDYARRALYLPEAKGFRAWNVPGGRGWRRGENVSEAVPLEGNAVMALALAKAHAATGRKDHRELAETLVASMSRLDPWLFDDDPDDAGKLYLADFVPLLRAQDHLIRGSAKATSTQTAIGGDHAASR